MPPIVDNSFLVLPDLHCPFQDNVFIDKCINLANIWGIKDCIIAGDLLDLEPYSSYLADESRLVDASLSSAEGVINQLTSTFTNIKWIMGNHEERLLKKLGKNQISFDRLKRLVTPSPIVEFSNYYFALSSDDRWMICHPHEFSVTNPVGVASYLATKYRKNVIAGHMHIIAEGQDITGEYLGIIVGTCADPKKLDYDAMRPTKKPEMVNGAAIVKNSYHWMLTKWSDWSSLERIHGRIGSRSTKTSNS